jgi:hypothetical protein
MHLHVFSAEGAHLREIDSNSGLFTSGVHYHLPKDNFTHIWLHKKWGSSPYLGALVVERRSSTATDLAPPATSIDLTGLETFVFRALPPLEGLPVFHGHTLPWARSDGEKRVAGIAPTQ